MRNQVFKKLFPVLLALIMVAGLLPASAMAGGWGAMDVDTTPELTETEQPAEPTPAQGEPVAEPTPEQGEPTAEPTEEITIAPVNEVVAQAATTDDMYVKKEGNGKRLEDETFYRIFLLDCGRKYFTVDEIKGIIDLLKANHYTHIELAFGNEGLRLLLNEKDTLSFKNNGVVVEKTGTQINEAIQYGNDQLDNVAGYKPGEKEEFTQAEMSDIISYAKGQGIGVIPLFNAPGHMYTVVKAMEKLELNANSITVENVGGGKTANVAIDPTNANAVYFVQALMQKYVDYFRDEGCKFFNIGADESGIKESNYSAYAQLVNSHAAMVQNAGMIPMAFNDGIYNPSYASISNNKGLFDSNIVISYWDAGGGKNYAQASELENADHVINSTHNNWYYVLGNNNSNWAGLNTALNNMKNVKCNQVDSTNNSFTTAHGCTLAVWCDYPSNDYTDNSKNVTNLISTFAVQNPTYFKAEEVKTPTVTVDQDNKTVKEVTKTADNTYKVVLNKATGGTAESQTLQLNVANGAEGATYTWMSDNEKVAIVENGNGLVTFKGAAGTVTITATPVTPTRSINETAAYSITLNVEVEGDVKLEEETITITVGQDATRKQDGKAEITSDYDATVVTISTEVKNVPGSTGKPTKVTTLVSGSKYIISDGNGNYLKRIGTSLSNVPSPDDATEWTVTYGTQASDTAWLISDDSYYLSYYYNRSWGLYVRTDTTQYVSWAYNNNGFKYYDGNNYLKYRNNNWTVTSNNSGNYGAAYEKGEATPDGEQTTITFNGVKEGETTVVIGNVKYNITVTKENLTNVAALPVQLWITNYAIEADYKTSENYWAPTNWNSKNNNAFYVNIEADTDGVNSDVGKSINELMPEGAKINVTDKPIGAYEYGGTYYKTNTYDTKKVAKQLVVWSGRVHNYSDGNIQKLYGTDYSNAGTEFKYIRYFNREWAVSNDRVNWTPVKGTNSINDEQIVVYYMIRSEITAEITTDVADWGSQQGEGAYTTQVSSNKGDFVLLDFRVKYYDGVVRPENFAVANKTFAFHCTPNDSGGAVHQKNGYYYRDLNNFRAVNTSNYEVYMVTVTMTSDAPSDMLNATQANTVNGGYTYNGEEQVLWAIDDETFAKSGLDKYTSISGSGVYSVNEFGDEPYIRGVEVYSKHGALITYYVREKEVTDFLTVNYYVQGETTPFYTYTISVKPNTVFSQDFRRVSETQLTGNTVENVIGVTQTVQWDLKLMPQIGAQYRYTDYTFTAANRESDGKTVNLYYTFNATKTFVVDFGLPLRIEPKDLNENLGDIGVSIAETKLTGVSNFAYVSADTNGVITYKLKEMISQSDTFGVQYTGNLVKDDGNLQVGTTAKYTVTIIPATNVYYEDSFAKFTSGSYGENNTLIDWEKVGETLTENQALETLGQEKHNPYGYDPAYDKCTMFSMGSAQKVTVTQDMAKDGVVWPTAQFTFKGTGFDIISLTDNTSGAIFVDVVNKETGVKADSLFVNNYYGYKYNETSKTWETVQTGNNALYQIPVIAVRGLDYNEYNVVITVAYNTFFDKTTHKEYSFWLDAVRVYDPMGKDNAIYNTGNEKEGYPQYIKLRSELKKLNSDGTASSGALFIDGKENANISEYANYGPNNEVYLANGQAITFMLTGNDLSKIATVQIGAKSPNSNETNKASMVIGSITKDLNTATEMYYDITTAAVKNGNAELVTIINTGEAILSLTNLKITYTDGNQTVSLGEVRAEQQTQAVQVVRALFAPAPVEPEPEPEPEKTFEPERFEASWSRNVMQGRKATLTVKTSEDVEAITVDGQTIRSYRTRTERVGFGRRAKRITYREFTYSMVAQESADFSVTAINAEGTESEAITARLTVKTRPNSMRDMWDWFKGWF